MRLRPLKRFNKSPLILRLSVRRPQSRAVMGLPEPETRWTCSPLEPRVKTMNTSTANNRHNWAIPNRFSSTTYSLYVRISAQLTVEGRTSSAR